MNPIARGAVTTQKLINPSIAGGAVKSALLSGAPRKQTTGQYIDSTNDFLKRLDTEYASLQKQIANMLYQVNNQPRAATPNFSAINAQARKAAAKAVNPFYVKELNTFLKGQKIKKQRSQNDYRSTIKDLQDALNTSFETSGINRERTAEDVATNLEEVANTENLFQTQEGQQFEQARQTLGGEVAQAGLTDSGLGAQQQQQVVAQRNVESKEQTRSFNVQRQAQELFKTRTFADLARGEAQAKTQTGKQKKYAKIDLDRYVSDLARETTGGKRQLEQQRLGAISQEQDRQRSLGFQRFLQTLTGNPGVLAETARTFGGSF